MSIITKTLAIALLSFVAYAFLADYLGYEFPQKEVTESVPAEAAEHRVKRIVDGDTVYMRDGTKVRLHGIDTPERDHHTAPRQLPP